VTQTESDWTAYRQARNEVNSLMKDAYHRYSHHLFDDSHLNSRKRFWSLIKHMRKDYSSITSLEVDGKCLTSSQDP